MSRRWHILVADDEPVMRESLAAWLAEDGHAVTAAASGEEAVAAARTQPFAVCLVDLKMPGMDGLETMRALQAVQPDTAVVIVTAYATVDTAITAIREGAADYIVKPCNPEEISLLVERIVRVKKLERENLILRRRLARHYRFQDIVSKNPRMHEIFELIRQVASLPSTVLVEGESGTGKELVARAIHAAGERAAGPFVPVSCGAVVETLHESELFGHEKGAFTGAVARKRGKLELAHGGTLFLDEISQVPLRAQVDLLRVLQERRFCRVGGTEELEVDVRVIAATNVHLKDEVRAGRFREDLFYRINVISIQLPPLRERREDIPLLAAHFVERFAAELGRPARELSGDAVKRLMAHPWPGNVRELENAVERAMVTGQGEVLGAADLAFLDDGGVVREWAPPQGATLREMEQRLVAATLDRCGGNVTEAATVLGIDRSTLYDKIRRYRLR